MGRSRAVAKFRAAAVFGGLLLMPLWIGECTCPVFRSPALVMLNSLIADPGAILKKFLMPSALPAPDMRPALKQRGCRMCTSKAGGAEEHSQLPAALRGSALCVAGSAGRGSSYEHWRCVGGCRMGVISVICWRLPYQRKKLEALQEITTTATRSNRTSTRSQMPAIKY